MFSAKPIVLVLSKIDLKKFEDLTTSEQALIKGLHEKHNAFVITMSNLSGEGVADVKQNACDMLLEYRLSQKAKDPKKMESALGRLHVAQPRSDGV